MQIIATTASLKITIIDHFNGTLHPAQLRVHTDTETLLCDKTVRRKRSVTQHRNLTNIHNIMNYHSEIFMMTNYTF